MKKLARSDGFLSPQGWPPNPGRNQAEPPPPSHSTQGMRLAAAVYLNSQSRDVPQTAVHPEQGRHDWRGEVVRQQAPLFRPTGWRDLIGAFVARVAKQKTVLNAILYKGQLPMSEQPKLKKPDPWSDPTRGAP